MTLGLTLAMKREKTRNLILDRLRREKDCTARQLSYELSVYGIWLSSVQVAGLMHSDDVLRESVTTEFVRRFKWAGLVYSLVPDRRTP